jgi:deoxyribodipyrimidine photo-lyase
LVLRYGGPEVELPKIIDLINDDVKIYLQTETTYEEISSIKFVKKALPDCEIVSVWDGTLFNYTELPFNIYELPDVFTNFRKQVEKYSSVNELITAPDRVTPIPKNIEPGKLPTLTELGLDEIPSDSRSVIEFEGGETNGLERLNSYLWETKSLSNYKHTRNGLLGENYSSKFSPWLASGCISPCKIYWEVKKFEQQVVKNQSTYWMIFELIWRDYFKFVSLKFGNEIFKSGGIKGIHKKWQFDKTKFTAWANGKTGIPFIDANMRELNAAGFMSNRGRQNVASFLVKDLNIDWRYGAEYFESYLIDYDPASNYGNWNYVAGIGNDPRENRYFNVISQAKRYDKEGEYVRNWLPELKNLSSEIIHTPFKLSNNEFSKLNYDKPIFINKKW